MLCAEIASRLRGADDAIQGAKAFLARKETPSNGQQQ